jgi:hypothetical protein
MYKKRLKLNSIIVGERLLSNRKEIKVKKVIVYLDSKDLLIPKKLVCLEGIYVSGEMLPFIKRISKKLYSN